MNVVRELFQHLDARFMVTSIRVAEALKMSCNAFHALKITFANEIGRVSQALGIDSHEVMRLVCADTRLNISPAYLRPGFAFGEGADVFEVGVFAPQFEQELSTGNGAGRVFESADVAGVAVVDPQRGARFHPDDRAVA